MSDWIQELNERSKDDKAIIVGSEVRALVAEIARLREGYRVSELNRARAEADVEIWKAQVKRAEEAQVFQSQRALAAEAKVERLTRDGEEAVRLWKAGLTAQVAAEAARDEALVALGDLMSVFGVGHDGHRGPPMDRFIANARTVLARHGKGVGR